MDYGASSAAGSFISTVIATRSANKIAGINAAAANYVRGKNNEVVDAENARDSVLTGLQRWRQKVYNDRVMSNAVSDQEMLTVNFNRQQDARARASFSDQIHYAEQEGAMAAKAAASGITGSVVDILNMSLHMKKGMEDTQRAEADRQMTYDEGRKETSTWFANMDKMDTSLIMDNPRQHDYGVNIALRMSPLTGIKPSDIKTMGQSASSFSFNSPAPYSLDTFYTGHGTGGD